MRCRMCNQEVEQLFDGSDWCEACVWQELDAQAEEDSLRQKPQVFAPLAGSPYEDWPVLEIEPDELVVITESP